MFKIIQIPLPANKEAEVHGYVIAAATNPEMRKWTVTAQVTDGTDASFWALASQFQIYPPQWKVIKPGTHSINVDTMDRDDWAVFTNYFDLQRSEYFTDFRYVGYPNNGAQDTANIARQINIDTYNGVFKPYLGKA